MTGNRPFDNPSSQAERLATHRNDERVRKNTYLSHTHPDEDGRFATSDQPPRHVVGSTPMPRYPAGPNWSDDPTGIEAPLGVAIDQMEPVGEAYGRLKRRRNP